jgi:hypothetical protein
MRRLPGDDLDLACGMAHVVRHNMCVTCGRGAAFTVRRTLVSGRRGAGMVCEALACTTGCTCICRWGVG